MSKFKEGLEEQTFIENYQIDEQSTLDDNWLDTHIIVNDIIIFLYEEEDFVTLARERYFLQNLQYHLETSTFSINFLALGNSDFKHPINLAADFVYNDSEEAANNIISDLHTLSKQSDLNSFLKDRKPYSWNIAPNGY